MIRTPCGANVGRCPGAGQCCDEQRGVCVTGPDACMAIAPRVLGKAGYGRYDGPPGVVSMPFVRPGDGDAPSVCPGDGDAGGNKGPRCGAGPNALCPWSPHARDDLCCVQDPAASGGRPDRPFEGRCAPCASADGDRVRTVLFDGRWMLL